MSDLVISVLASVIAAAVLASSGFVARLVMRRLAKRKFSKRPKTRIDPVPDLGARGHAVVDLIARVRTNAADSEIVLVGAVYLDIIIYPVDTDRLEHHEWADIEPLSMSPGGAAYFVGHDLARQFGRRSYLYSGFGSPEDTLSNVLSQMLSAEAWVKNNLDTFQGESQSAISVHLTQRDHARTAIFTHRGAVARLGWAQLSRPLLETLEGRGGIMLISGFFKTQLHIGLREQLKRLKAHDVLVVADPGTIDVSSTERNQLSNLRDALKAGLIDVHVCGFGEFLSVYGLGKGAQRPRTLADLTAQISAVAARLAPVVFIRGNDLPDGLASIAIAGGAVCATRTDETARTRSAHVGTKNGFTAGLIDALLAGPPVASIEDVANFCSDAALDGWKVACE